MSNAQGNHAQSRFEIAYALWSVQFQHYERIVAAKTASFTAR
jgi:hypothetical protein